MEIRANPGTIGEGSVQKAVSTGSANCSRRSIKVFVSHSHRLRMSGQPSTGPPWTTAIRPSRTRPPPGPTCHPRRPWTGCWTVPRTVASCRVRKPSLWLRRASIAADPEEPVIVLGEFATILHLLGSAILAGRPNVPEPPVSQSMGIAAERSEADERQRRRSTTWLEITRLQFRLACPLITDRVATGAAGKLGSGPSSLNCDACGPARTPLGRKESAGAVTKGIHGLQHHLRP